MNRLGAGAFAIQVPERSRHFLLAEGTSAEYGARELKRTLHRRLIQPMSAMVAADKIRPGSMARLDYIDETRSWEIVPNLECCGSDVECFTSVIARRKPRRVAQRRLTRDSLRLTA